jgi:hypothetical protein
VTVANRPTLLNACARAATAAEARFRIDVPIAPARSTRVVALDDAALAVVRQAAAQQWSGGARFLSATAAVAEPAADVVLTSVDGGESWLSAELEGADVAVMVATSNEGAAAASSIGNACTLRGIMTAGLILATAQGAGADQAVAALRPHARVLLVTQDAVDVVEVLTALRA